MNTVHCAHFDQLARELVETYRRLEDRDLFCLMAGKDGPDEIEAAHLAMAEHRVECPLCRHLDGTPSNEAAFNLLNHSAQPIY